jgi:hypothetical protein
MRSLPVSSEEGAALGIGVWCEMGISDPVAFQFKNIDPAGSLRANVSNATVRCLSNMPDALPSRRPPERERESCPPAGARTASDETPGSHSARAPALPVPAVPPVAGERRRGSGTGESWGTVRIRE